MPIDPNKVGKIYNALKEDGYTQSYEDFKAGFYGNEHYENRKKVFDYLHENGAQVGNTYEEFMDILQSRPKTQAAQTPATSPSQQQPSQGQTGAASQSTMWMPDVDSGTMYQHMVNSLQQKQPQWGVATEAARQAGHVDAAQETPQEVAAGNRAAIPKEAYDYSAGQQLRDEWDYSRLTGGRSLQKDGHIFDSTGGIMTAKLARDEKGNVVMGDNGKPMLTFTTEKGARAMVQDIRERAKEQEATTTDKRLEALKAEQKRLDEAMMKRHKELMDLPQAKGPYAGYYMQSIIDSDKEYSQLMAAWRKNRQAMQLLEDAKSGQTDSFFHTMGTTLSDGYSFTMGKSHIDDKIAADYAVKNIENLNRKIASGEKLTREEEATLHLVQADMANEEIQGIYGDQYGAWARAAKTTTGSVELVGDFLSTGGLAGSITKTVAKGVTKAGVKAMSKVAGQTAKEVLKSQIKKGFLKGTGILAGTMAGGASVTFTSGLGRTAGEASQMMAGHASVNDKGEIEMTDRRGVMESVVEAAYQGVKENASEMAGMFIGGSVGGAVLKGLKRLGLSRVAGTLTKIGGKEWYKQLNSLLEYGGYNGLPGEIMEEYVGYGYDMLFGHGKQALTELKDPRTHLDIMLGCATTGALMGALPVVVQGAQSAQYLRYKNRVGKRDKAARATFGDPKQWDELRDEIDNTPNEQMAAKAESLFYVLPEEQMKAVMDYMLDLQRMRGYSIGMLNAEQEQAAEQAVKGDMSAQRDAGIADTDPQQMHERQVDMEVADVMMEAVVGKEVADKVRQNPESIVDLAASGEYTDEQLAAMRRYADASSHVSGIRERMQQEADAEVQQRMQQIDSITNKDTGEIITVHETDVNGNTLVDEEGRSVMRHVTAGKLVLRDDGTIDTEASTASVTLLNPTTGEVEMVSPSDIHAESIVTGSAEELRKASEASIRQEVAQRYDATLRGGNPDVSRGGAEFRIVGYDGTPCTVRLASGANGEAVANTEGALLCDVVDEGNGQVAGQVNLTPSQLRDLSHRRAVQERIDAERSMMQQAATPASDAQPFTVGQSLTLSDGQGGMVRGDVIDDADENGRITVALDKPMPDGSETLLLSPEELKGMVVQEGSVQEEGESKNDGAPAQNGIEVGSSLTEEQALALVERMEAASDVAEEIPLTIENWDALFGEEGNVSTPLGSVKMGENQFAKMMRHGRNTKLGMVKPTLENPYVIVEEESSPSDGTDAERGSSYVFIRSFKKQDGSRYYYFTNITVSKDGKEVVVSNQEKSRNKVLRLLQEGRVAWCTPKDATAASAERQGLDYGQANEADAAAKGSGITPQTTPSSASKDTAVASDTQALEDENAASTVVNALQPIPVEKDKKGKAVRTLYHQVPLQRTLEDLYDGSLTQAEIDAFVDNYITQSRKRIESLVSKKPQIGTDKQAYLEEKARHQQALHEAQAELNYYEQLRQEVQRITQRTTQQQDNAASSVHDDVAEPASLAELAADFAARHKVTPESLKAETGMAASELKGYVGLVAGADKGGITIERMAEKLAESPEWEHMGGTPDMMQDARNMLIEAYLSGNPRSAIRQRRERMAREARERELMEVEDFAQRAYHMSAEEYLAYEEQAIPAIIQRYAGFDYDAYASELSDEDVRNAAEYATLQQKASPATTNNTHEETNPITDNQNGQQAESTRNGAGSQVLPQQGTAHKQRNSTDGQPAEGQQAGTDNAWIQGNPAQATVGEEQQAGGAIATAEADATDAQGNPVNPDGTLKLEKITSVDELTDEDFSNPTRNVELPALPENVDKAIGAGGKPVVIKKNIFERNAARHGDLSADDSRDILKSALYNPNLYGQNQKTKRPYNWVVINTKDKAGNNRLVLLELSPQKENVEIVHWHYVDEKGLEKIKRQAEREDGQLLILPSETEEAGALSSPTPDLSSVGKDKAEKADVQTPAEENAENAVDKEEDKFKEAVTSLLKALQQEGKTDEEIERDVRALLETFSKPTLNGIISSYLASLNTKNPQHLKALSRLEQALKGMGITVKQGARGIAAGDVAFTSAYDEPFTWYTVQSAHTPSAIKQQKDRINSLVATASNQSLTPTERANALNELRATIPHYAGKFEQDGQFFDDRVSINEYLRSIEEIKIEGKDKTLPRFKINGYYRVKKPSKKKEKPVSASSSDIETEPEGKRNGTATPQNGAISFGKDKAEKADVQATAAENAENASGEKGSGTATRALDGVKEMIAATARREHVDDGAFRKLVESLTYDELKDALEFADKKKGRSKTDRENIGFLRDIIKYMQDEMEYAQDTDAAEMKGYEYIMELSLSYPSDFDFAYYAKSKERDVADYDRRGHVGHAALNRGILRAAMELQAKASAHEQDVQDPVEKNEQLNEKESSATSSAHERDVQTPATGNEQLNEKERRAKEAVEALRKKAISIPGITVFEFVPNYYKDGSGAVVYGTKTRRNVIQVNSVDEQYVEESVNIHLLSDEKRSDNEALSKVKDANSYANYLVEHSGVPRREANMKALHAGNEMYNFVRIAKDALFADRWAREVEIPLCDAIIGKKKDVQAPAEEKSQDGQSDSAMLYHKEADGAADAVTSEEAALRDALMGKLQEAGIDVVTDAEEAQRVLDEVNGDARMQAKKRALETVSAASDRQHHQTVVSSADGAKVLNNLDKLVSDYEENEKTHEKTFIGTVANALGAQRKGSKSEYATFETKNGRVVTIRLADHNATVSNFDRRGELDGISIVVSPKKSAGVTNDGEAHVVEYYYDAIKLRKANGKPLADIVRAIKQALYSGEFKDTTGLAERQEVNARELRQSVGVKMQKNPMTAEEQKHKETQLSIIHDTNPAPDDYHTWVRSIDDILTLQEAIDAVLAEDPEYELSTYPDVSDDMIREALRTGRITVYSSKPIKNGVFVTPSMMQAMDYSGGTKVFSKEVPIRNVAWINTDEGQYAATSGEATSQDKELRFFRTPDGHAYGFTVGGKIYIEPRIAKADTPIHEYTHLWSAAVRQGDAKAWADIVRLMQGTPLWDEVAQHYPELAEDVDALADEVLAHFSGRRGAERLREAQRVAMEQDGLDAQAAAVAAVERVRQALKRFWRKVADFFGRRFTTAEEVADTVLSDMLHGVKPAFDAKDGGVRYDANSEEAGIVARAKADGTYMKAPNGQPSKLTPRQWVQVRTQAFKAWFGDWEKAARIEKLRKSEDAFITGKEIELTEDFKQNKRNALAYGKKLQGEYTNADTGVSVQLQRGRKNGGINEVLQHNYKDDAHILSVAAIPQVIEKSIYIDSEPNKDAAKNPDVVEYQHFVCGLKIGNEDYTVHSLVAVDKNGNRYYDHNLTQIEKTKLLDSIERQAVRGQGFDTTSGTEPTTLNGYKGKQLSELLKTNSSKVVDENGEPRVVYHGTQSEFNAFDKDAVRERGDGVKGFFFAPAARRESVAGYYAQHGGSIMPVFLNLKRPLVLSTSETLGAPGIADGYDGIISTAASDSESRYYDYEQKRVATERLNKGDIVEIVAFEPSQIKSAEENVGTFDGSNHDIRYQVVKRGTLSAEEVDELVQSLRSVDSEEVLRGMNLSGLYDTLRRLSILNENAYKGYGWISNAMAKQNGKIYSLKGSLLLKLTDELIRRGEDVGYHDGVLYFRDRNTGIQYSYHTSTYLYSNDPYENFNYTNKRPKWDGVRRGFTMTKEQYAQARIRAQQTMDARKRVAKACSEDAAETMKRVLKNGGRRSRLLGKGVAYADVVSMIDHVMSGRNYNIYAEENVSDATIGLIASNALGVKDYDTRKWFVGVVLDNMRKPLSEYRKEWMQPAGKVEKTYKDPPIPDAKNSETDAEVLLREGEGVVSDAVLSEENDALGKMGIERTEEERAAFAERERGRMERMAHRVAEELGLDEDAVQVVTDVNEITEPKLRKAKGWFDPKTGKITVVIPNHTGTGDVLRTMLHEAVAHKGLRGLFGKRFDVFLDNVYAAADETVRRRISTLASQHGWDFRRATEEYLAGLAEDMHFEHVSPSFWQKIKLLFLQMLDRLGIRGYDAVTLTDNELRYVLWRSYQHMAHAGRYRSMEEVADKADAERAAEEDDAVRRSLRVGEYSDATADAAEAERAYAAERAADEAGMDVLLREGAEDEAASDTSGEQMQGGVAATRDELRARALQEHAVHQQDFQRKLDAIGRQMGKLRQALAAQRAYDKSTVGILSGLARTMLKLGMLDKMSQSEVSRLLTLMNAANGKADLTKDVDALFDLMTKNLLRVSTARLGSLLKSRKGSTAKGAAKMGKLDAAGEQIADTVRRYCTLNDAQLSEMIADAEERMDSRNEAVAEWAANEYTGLLLARQCANDIIKSREEEKLLRKSLQDAKTDLEAGVMTRDAYDEFAKATHDALRENRVGRCDAYASLISQLTGIMSDSRERAKQWRDAERERVNHIHHLANSDMQGRKTNEHRKAGGLTETLNNLSLVRFLLEPTATFEKFMRMLGSKHVHGEGNLYEKFVRGGNKCREKELRGYRDAIKALDAKAQEVLGVSHWSDIASMLRDMPTCEVAFMDGGERTNHTLTQGNLLYIYMVNKMSDGKMKLRKMGISEGDVDAIKEVLDPRFVTLADWMQDEFLPSLRTKYNAVHKRMFGTSMASIDHYFPLRILSADRSEDVDVSQDDNSDLGLPSTHTGSIIKRTRNTKALDLLNTDAFQTICSHIQEMEHWSAYAEYCRDLNTLLSYKRFRNQMKNMDTLYGSGDFLWRHFRDVCKIAVGAYKPKRSVADSLMVNLAKGATHAKIAFRIYTALKQFLSMPAFMTDASMRDLAYNMAHPREAWTWCMENLPVFEERWKSRMSGDPRLMKTDVDWKTWRSNVAQIASRYGMAPNAFVDALTVCIGAHSIYQTRLRQYMEDGYSEEQAMERARGDASILFNQTQQSSEGMYLSRMQVDRTYGSLLFSVFRNSSMSYTRMLIDSLRSLRQMCTPGYKEQSIEFMTKQLIRDGLSPSDARSAAERRYTRAWWRNVSGVLVYGFALPLLWNMGAVMPYLLMGDDDDRKEKFLEDCFIHSLFGPVEGLTGGDVMSGGLNMLFGDHSGKRWEYLKKEMPFSSDLYSIMQKLDYDWLTGLNDVACLMVQTGFGFNPKTFADGIAAVIDYIGSEKDLDEFGLLLLRLANAPASQTDAIYFDELGCSSLDASKMTPRELVLRYAAYKRIVNAPMTNWAYGDEHGTVVDGRLVKRGVDIVRDRYSEPYLGEKDVRQLLDYASRFDKQKQALQPFLNIDPERYYDGMERLYATYDVGLCFGVEAYRKAIGEMTDALLRAKSVDERRAIVKNMEAARYNLLHSEGVQRAIGKPRE